MKSVVKNFLVSRVSGPGEFQRFGGVARSFASRAIRDVCPQEIEQEETEATEEEVFCRGECRCSGGFVEHSGGEIECSGKLVEHSGGEIQHSGGLVGCSGGLIKRSGGGIDCSGGLVKHSGGVIQRSGGLVGHSVWEIQHSSGDETSPPECHVVKSKEGRSPNRPCP